MPRPDQEFKGEFWTNRGIAPEVVRERGYLRYEKHDISMVNTRWIGERRIMDTNGLLKRSIRLLGTVELMIRAGGVAAVVVERGVILSPSTVVLVGVAPCISLTTISFSPPFCEDVPDETHSRWRTTAL